MTSTLTARPRQDLVRGARRALVALEASRSLKAPWVWVGIALAAWVGFGSLSADFANGGYSAVMASFAVVAASLFVLGVRVGGRDHTINGLVAPEATLDADERAIGRLLGLWPAVLVAVLFAGVVWAIQLIEGGMWIADAPVGRTDATYSFVEMLQPVVVFVLAATAGVALGRASAHQTIISVAGGLVISAFGGVSWAFQWSPALWVTLIQTHPVEVGLGAGFVPSTAPTTWLLSAPTEYEPHWGRVMVHQALAMWHVCFLAGLAVAFAGLAVRGRYGRSAVIVGLAISVVAIAAEVIVSPAGLRGA